MHRIYAKELKDANESPVQCMRSKIGNVAKHAIFQYLKTMIALKS
uniref:Uncharacterized protein n=2 Tax=Anguilla anguilla TaxID=7936 RepID=A0A0E9RTS4_ANGAN